MIMKKLLIPVICLCLAAALWGCGGQKPQPTVEAAATATQTPEATTQITEATRATGEVEVDFSDFVWEELP
jgi:Flp pilus assembly protein TadD